MCILKPNRPKQTRPTSDSCTCMSTSKEVASKEEASREDKDTANIKDTYLSMDGIPTTITVYERSDGIPPTIVQFTSGHRFGDKSALTTNNFAWDNRMKTNVRIWAKDTCLSSLLKTYAIEPQYIMPDHDAEFKGHCLLRSRCYMPHGLYYDIHLALTREGFKWSREMRAWIKKMKSVDYRNDIVNSFKKTPPRLCHGTDEVQDAKQNIKQVRQEKRNFASQLEYQDASFERKRADLMYRLHKADSDPDYRRASDSYGQHIKQLAEQGIHNYPDPPKLPWYR